MEEINQEDEKNFIQYETLLNFTREGVMGYIEIPRIECDAAIYHGVNDDVLSKGLVVHNPETSLPVDGESIHAVLAAHSGMSNIGQIPNLEKLVATIRSREISCALVLQA